MNHNGVSNRYKKAKIVHVDQVKPNDETILPCIHHERNTFIPIHETETYSHHLEYLHQNCMANEFHNDDNLYDQNNYVWESIWNAMDDDDDDADDISALTEFSSKMKKVTQRLESISTDMIPNTMVVPITVGVSNSFSSMDLYPPSEISITIKHRSQEHSPVSHQSKSHGMIRSCFVSGSTSNSGADAQGDYSDTVDESCFPMIARCNAFDEYDNDVLDDEIILANSTHLPYHSYHYSECTYRSLRPSPLHLHEFELWTNDHSIENPLRSLSCPPPPPKHQLNKRNSKSKKISWKTLRSLRYRCSI